MDVDQEVGIQQIGSGRGPSTGARSGTTGDGDTSSTGVTWIRPSRPFRDSVISFSKTRIMFSCGYSTENIQTAAIIDQATTSLALIAVVVVPFYLNVTEFDMLPTTAEVITVTCQDAPLGTRTAFDVGASISGSATSEYVPIELVAKGLNKEFYGRNSIYHSEATDPMKVTDLRHLEVKEMYSKYYKHIPSNALCVPTPITEYFVHGWNREKAPDKTDDYIVHNKGSVRMDEKVQ